MLPWKTRGIGQSPLVPSAPIAMVPIGSIRPVHGRPTRAAKPIDPTIPYEPLILDSRGRLQDGYHRYYDLVDSGYSGVVPCITIDA